MTSQLIKTLWILPWLAAIAVPTVALAADPTDPEDFHVEVTGSAWIVDTSGTVHSDGTSIDLRSDLGFEQQIATFTGKLVFKPRRRQRIFIEGTPLSGSGTNTVNRSITYHGQVFNVSDTVSSSVDLTMLLVGYQYDIISNRYGHLGVSVSGAYLNGTGTLTSLTANTTSSSSQQIGLPIAGAEFRVFPIPGHKWLDLDGGVRGMAYGSYGHYVEGNGNVAIWLANHFSLAAGYRRIDTQLQNNDNPLTSSGLNVSLRGPIFSAGFKW